MKLEGEYEIPAPRAKVWDAFLDPNVLQKAIPGCEKLEALGNDEYKATLKIGVGGVKGTFEGKVRLSDKKPTDSYKMAAEAPHRATVGLRLLNSATVCPTCLHRDPGRPGPTRCQWSLSGPHWASSGCCPTKCGGTNSRHG